MWDRVEHLQPCVDVKKAQINARHGFMFELSWDVWSWKLPMVVVVASIEGVQVGEWHLCANGQQAVDADGYAASTGKPTGWMTHSSCVAAAVSLRCSNESTFSENHSQGLEIDEWPRLRCGKVSSAADDCRALGVEGSTRASTISECIGNWRDR